MRETLYKDAHPLHKVSEKNFYFIFLKKKPPSKYEVMHESYHARQNYQLGDQKYNAQTELEKEEYVFDKLMEQKNELKEHQIGHAKDYIDIVRKRHAKINKQ